MGNKPGKRNEDGLSARQVKAIEILTSPEGYTWTNAQIGQVVGVTDKTVSRWRSNKKFQEALRKRIDHYALRLLPYAWDCLRERMQKDTQALKLYFSLVGQHRDQVDVSGPGGGPVQLAALRDMSDEDLQALVEAD